MPPALSSAPVMRSRMTVVVLFGTPAGRPGPFLTLPSAPTRPLPAGIGPPVGFRPDMITCPCVARSQQGLRSLARVRESNPLTAGPALGSWRPSPRADSRARSPQPAGRGAHQWLRSHGSTGRCQWPDCGKTSGRSRGLCGLMCCRTSFHFAFLHRHLDQQHSAHLLGVGFLVGPGAFLHAFVDILARLLKHLGFGLHCVVSDCACMDARSLPLKSRMILCTAAV